MHSGERLQAICDETEHGLVGRTLGGTYHIVRPLGTGGMGAVYEGLDINLNRRVAVKVIKPELTAVRAMKEEFYERFRREARATAKVEHPNVVSVHHFDVTEDGTAYLVMEYIEGQTLARTIRTKGALSPLDAIDIAAQILRGLYAIHRANVVHRDLKPANIVLRTLPNGRMRASIVDFGLGKIGGSGERTLTSVGVPVGTPRYMSPEQCYGDRVDERSDLYSLGIILYEMLTGRPPFDGDTPVGIMTCQTTKPLPPFPSGVPKGLADVAQKAAQKARSARYQGAPEMIRDLHMSRPKPRQRSAGKPLAVAGALCALAALLVFATWHFELSAIGGSGNGVARVPKVSAEVSAPETEAPHEEERAEPVPENEPQDIRDPEKLFRRAESYSMKGKPDLMAGTYREFLRACRGSRANICRNKANIRFARKRVQDVE